MKSFRALSAIEQLAAHLRGEIQAGALGGTLPGVHRLAKELGVSPKSVVAAVADATVMTSGDPALSTPSSAETGSIDSLSTLT